MAQNWDGGGDWQRVFDFGTGTRQYLCRTSKAGGGGLRLVLKDAINGKTGIPGERSDPGHRSVGAARSGAEGALHDTVRERQTSRLGLRNREQPSPVSRHKQLHGKSHYRDPLFNRRVDDFRVYCKALAGAEVWSPWGQSINAAPVFATETIIRPTASFLEPYAGHTLTSFASDANSGALTFAKLHGPAPLTVASNGVLSDRPPYKSFINRWPGHETGRVIAV